MAARLAVLVVVVHIAHVAECANLKGAAPPGMEKAGMMGAMMEGMIATMKAATGNQKAPVQELTVPVAPMMVEGEDISDGNINDAFSKAMAITEDEDDLDEPIVSAVAQHVKAVAVATMPVVATSSVQLGMMEKALAAERAVNRQLELKVGDEEKKIRVIQKQAVRKIKTLKKEVLGLKARLGAAPVAPPALVAVAAPVVKAAPVVQVIAPAAPVAKAAPVVLVAAPVAQAAAVVAVAAPVAQAAPVVPVAAPVAQAAPVVQVAAPVAPRGPPKKMNMMDMMNLFAKVQGDALANTMHTKLKANLAQQHLEVIKSARRAAGSFTHHHDHFRGIVKHEVAPQTIKFKDLLQVSESTGRLSADVVD